MLTILFRTYVELNRTLSQQVNQQSWEKWDIQSSHEYNAMSRSHNVERNWFTKLTKCMPYWALESIRLAELRRP